MNNFEIKIIEFGCPIKANEGVNEFIEDCNDNDIKILDITSHVVVDNDGYYSYVFVFKLQQKN